MLKKEIFQLYLPIIKKHRMLFVLMSLTGIIEGLSSVGLPLLMKMETDQLVGQSGSEFFGVNRSAFEVFIWILGTILVVNMLETLIVSIAKIFTESKSDIVQNEIQLSLFSKMQSMEIGRSMSARYKYISSIVESNFPSLTRKLVSLPQSVFEFVVKLFGFTAVYVYFDITLLGVVVISAIIGYFIETIGRKIRMKYEVERKLTLGRQIWKYSSLFLYDFPRLAISGGLSSTLNMYSNVLSEDNLKSVKRNFSDLVRNIQNIFNYSLRDIILKLIVGYGVFEGTKSVGMVVLVVSSMGSVGSMIRDLLQLRIKYKDFVMEQESILLMLRICTPAGSKDNPEPVKYIDLQNLTFAYPNHAEYEREYIEIVQKNAIGKTLGDNYLDRQIKELLESIDEDMKTPHPEIFCEVNLHFERGKVYGLVGKNGAGKTTLMYVLSGYFREYAGNILFNGNSSKDDTTESFLGKVSFLTQVPFMMDWSSTIKDNLLLGCPPTVTEADLWEYLEKFGLAKKLKKHKKGLLAEIGQDIDLSGGEKQLITFIRLLLQDRDIIILDEGTNQLDAENELLVMQELLKKKHDKIILFITHRMSTIAKADVIYCLEGGQITAEGTHKSLLSDGNNAYARFYKAQIGE